MTSLINVVKPNVTTVIGTDESWFNAIEIPREPFWVPPNTAKWVWGANDPFGAAAVVSRRFRIRRVRDVISATLFFAVDNYGVVLINGRPVINDIKQETPRFFTNGRTIDISDFLRNGINDIVTVGFNFGGPGTGRDSIFQEVQLIPLESLQDLLLRLRYHERFYQRNTDLKCLIS